MQCLWDQGTVRSSRRGGPSDNVGMMLNDEIINMCMSLLQVSRLNAAG
jgi:hypothetical protein